MKRESTILLGAVLRVVLTFVTFIIISKLFISKHLLFIILPIVLTLLDSSDNIYTHYRRFKGYKDIKSNCTFEYQSIDKVNDLLSYVLVWKWFGLDTLFLIFCVVRAIGVIAFILTKKSFPLMIFPDVLKEYLVYRYFFPTGFDWIYLVIIGKIAFEIYFHTIKNKTSY